MSVWLSFCLIFEKYQVHINHLIKMREVNFKKNPILVCLNIYSCRNKIVSLRNVVDKVYIDILCIDETILDDSFRDSQFLIENYQFPPFHRDRNSKAGSKIANFRRGLISRRWKNFELKTIETICVEFTISRKKWFILFVYAVCENPYKFPHEHWKDFE